MNSELRRDREFEEFFGRGPTGDFAKMSLGQLAALGGINLGVAVNCSNHLNQAAYVETVRQFASITPGSAMKINWVYPKRGEPNYAPADAIASHARTNIKGMRGHLAIGRSNIPSWLFGLTKGKVRALLEKYIKETIARYSDLVTDWDVAVELFDDEGRLRATLWSAVLGEQLFETLFAWAREANPNAKLFYSDFNLYKTAKQRAVLDMVETVNRDRHLIDGVAVQCHHNTVGVIKLMTAGKFLDELRSRGLTASLSEITIWCRGPFPRLLDFKAQAMAYNRVFQFGISHGVTDFCIWGVNDSTAWRHPKLTPFLFDGNYRPKPAEAAVRKYLLKRARELYFSEPYL